MPIIPDCNYSLSDTDKAIIRKQAEIVALKKVQAALLELAALPILSIRRDGTAEQCLELVNSRLAICENFVQGLETK